MERDDDDNSSSDTDKDEDDGDGDDGAAPDDPMKSDHGSDLPGSSGSAVTTKEGGVSISLTKAENEELFEMVFEEVNSVFINVDKAECVNIAEEFCII